MAPAAQRDKVGDVIQPLRVVAKGIRGKRDVVIKFQIPLHQLALAVGTAVAVLSEDLLPLLWRKTATPFLRGDECDAVSRRVRLSSDWRRS